ncbi:MAG TPA: hypothetical protein PLG73_02450 [Candidatus Sumerlaeota bacterium]|nr:hypothetical protein [Candidatus Sumerlaeota bacterium]
MLHVLLGQFEILRQQISKVVSDDMFEVLDVAWRDASERAVAMMEDALDNGLGLTPEKMIELAKTREQERNKEQGHAS